MLSFIKIILSLEFWKSFLFPLIAPHPHPKPYPGRGPKAPSLTRKAAAGQSSWPEQRALEAVGMRVVGVWRGLPPPSPPRGTQVPELPEERMEDSAAARSGRTESPGGAGGGRGVGGKGWAAPSRSLAYPPIPPSPLPARLPGHPGGGGSSAGSPGPPPASVDTTSLGWAVCAPR